jgi:hypothetical protein
MIALALTAIFANNFVKDFAIQANAGALVPRIIFNLTYFYCISLGLAAIILLSAYGRHERLSVMATAGALIYATVLLFSMEGSSPTQKSDFWIAVGVPYLDRSPVDLSRNVAYESGDRFTLAAFEKPHRDYPSMLWVK